MKPRVFNLKTDKIPSGVIYVGRPSKWGNPFVIGKDGNRTEVLLQYRHWVLSQPDFILQIKKELKGKDLSCFCSPHPCHGDILIEIANVSFIDRWLI